MTFPVAFIGKQCYNGFTKELKIHVFWKVKEGKMN
jgi:hypothetical protein